MFPVASKLRYTEENRDFSIRQYPKVMKQDKIQVVEARRKIYGGINNRITSGGCGYDQARPCSYMYSLSVTALRSWSDSSFPKYEYPGMPSLVTSL
jgi:hypothetical protein